MYDVLNISTGQLQSLSRGQLAAVLKKHERKAKQMLKSSRAAHVLYGVQHDTFVYHIMPCAVYSDDRFKACFGKGKKIKPLAVHRR